MLQRASQPTRWPSLLCTSGKELEEDTWDRKREDESLALAGTLVLGTGRRLARSQTRTRPRSPAPAGPRPEDTFLHSFSNRASRFSELSRVCFNDSKAL